MQSTASKLEPFLLMIKSAKGAAAAKLVEDATAAPGVYAFAELLESPNVQQLASTHASTLELLKLFASGTYRDYKQNEGNFPNLKPTQLAKLKQLSIVSLAGSSRILPYSHLLNTLDISSIRELEDLIIDAVYQDVLQGKLDQKEQQFEVEYTMGRDLAEGQIESLLIALNDWSERTAQVLTALDDKIAEANAEEAAARTQLEEHNRSRDTILQELQAKNNSGKGRSEDTPMDWEGPPSKDSRDDWSRKKKFGPGSMGSSGIPGNTRKRNRG
jgi:COP9 signalosome complex subunit 7